MGKNIRKRKILRIILRNVMQLFDRKILKDGFLSLINCFSHPFIITCNKDFISFQRTSISNHDLLDGEKGD